MHCLLRHAGQANVRQGPWNINLPHPEPPPCGAPPWRAYAPPRPAYASAPLQHSRHSIGAAGSACMLQLFCTLCRLRTHTACVLQPLYRAVLPCTALAACQSEPGQVSPTRMQLLYSPACCSWHQLINTWVGVLVVHRPGLDPLQAVVVAGPPAANVGVRAARLVHGDRSTIWAGAGERRHCPNASEHSSAQPGS